GLKGYERAGDAGDHGAFFDGLGARAGQVPGIIEGEGPASAGTPSLVVMAYRGEKTLERAQELGGASALGAILNMVPVQQMRYVERELRPALEATGLKVLGVLPEERALRAARVGDLAQFLSGEVVAGADFLDNEFQSVMIGAMSHQGGTT